MKRSRSLSVVTLAAIFILTLGVADSSTNATVQHCFRIKEYELFHDVLHPLKHEALPKGDFQRVRLIASEIVTRGRAIVKLGLPEAPRARRREFAKALRQFDSVLARFTTHARTGSNIRLKESYTAVHNSFEKLADLVPTVYPGGMPPMIWLHCPSGRPEGGSTVTLTADTGAPEGLLFLWTISVGKILSGQGTPTITIDTTGLNGQTISVSVEVNDGCGHTAATNCQIQVQDSKQPQHQASTPALLDVELSFKRSLNLKR